MNGPSSELLQVESPRLTWRPEEINAFVNSLPGNKKTGGFQETVRSILGRPLESLQEKFQPLRGVISLMTIAELEEEAQTGGGTLSPEVLKLLRAFQEKTLGEMLANNSIRPEDVGKLSGNNFTAVRIDEKNKIAAVEDPKT